MIATGAPVTANNLAMVKRIQQYKRQLLNALRIVIVYNRLPGNLHMEMLPRTPFFGGKAALAYYLAKLIIWRELLRTILS